MNPQSNNISLTSFDSDELIALAGVDMKNGQLESALLKVKHVLCGDGENSRALTLGAKLYAQLALFDKAKGLYKRLLEQSPESTTERFEYGMVHFDQGNISDALSIWHELLGMVPVHPPALFYRGLAQLQLGNEADARKSFGVLLQTAPADNLYFGRAKDLLTKLDQVNGNTSEAVNKAAGSLPKDAYKVLN
jgi:tetratricopeptide (TPR) repeat protein